MSFENSKNQGAICKHNNKKHNNKGWLSFARDRFNQSICEAVTNKLPRKGQVVRSESGKDSRCLGYGKTYSLFNR